MEVDFGRMWGLTLGVKGYWIPFGFMKGKVQKFLEVNPLKVVERVIKWSDGPPLRAKNLFRVRL
jgi:hypothetical protein